MFGFLQNKSRWTSPNFNDRGGVTPHMVIIHYTGMQTAKAALERLCDPASEVSAHVVIEESGVVHKLVPLEKRAWHAGQSHWQGLTDINAASIGIELVNKGHEFGYEAFPEKQIEALKLFLDNIVAKYDIRPQSILGHSDVAPARKIDPGEKFDWRALSEAGFGLWPAPTEMDYQAAQDVLLNDGAFIELLGAYGYDTSIDEKTLITAYHRHFYPEKFAAGEGLQMPDVLSVSRLLSLIRQAHEA